MPVEPAPPEAPETHLTWMKASGPATDFLKQVVDPPPAKYYLPPPHLFYRSSSRHRYLINYLRARPRLLSRLETWPFQLPGLRTDNWRIGLMGDGPDLSYSGRSIFDTNELPTGNLSQKELRSCIQMSFSWEFYDLTPWSAQSTADWRNAVVSFDQLSNDVLLRASILRELQELSFRVDLISAHLAELGIRVTASREVISSTVSECINAVSTAGQLLPCDSPDGLDIWEPELWTHRRRLFFQRFINLISRWPGAPQALDADVLNGDLDNKALGRLERTALEFFCGVFAHRFHRLPILPCII